MEIRVEPKLFHDFHFKVAMSLKLPLTSRKVLEEFVDIDVNTEAVAKIVQRNQYFENMLLQEIKSLGLKDNTPTLRAAIALLGMQRVRDFVCALQILRMVGRRHPKLGKDGKFDFKPADYLKYALKTEEYMSNRKMQYGDTGYAAGMMFDLVLSIGHELFEAGKQFDEYVDEVYKHGLKTAMVGVELAKTIKNFGFTKYVFAACLIHDIGKLAMELMYPSSSPNSFAAFRSDIGKKPVSREVIHFIEASRFGLTHEYYSSQMAYYFAVFRGIEKAILFHHDPYLIKTVNRDLYSLASLIALSSNVANHFRVPKDANDPIFKSWNTGDVRDFKIEPKILISMMGKLAHERF